MFLKTRIFPIFASLIFSILIICFAVSFYVFAWFEPGSSPPEDNVSPPLTVSNNLQMKSGSLIVNGMGNTIGFAVDGDLESGKVGIGTENPSYKLEVIGDVKANGFFASDGFSIWQGATSTVFVRGNDGSDCEIVFKNGLFISTTCPSGY